MWLLIIQLILMAVDFTVTARLVYKHFYGSDQVQTHHFDKKNCMLPFFPPDNADCI